MEWARDQAQHAGVCKLYFMRYKFHFLMDVLRNGAEGCNCGRDAKEAGGTHRRPEQKAKDHWAGQKAESIRRTDIAGSFSQESPLVHDGECFGTHTNPSSCHVGV